MLNIGDRVVYPMHGAGTVKDIIEREDNGEKKQFFILKMLFGNVDVTIPEDSINQIGLRNVISIEMVQELQEVLMGKPERLTGSWNKRFNANLDRLKSGSILEAAAVARNLILQDRQKKISSGERRLLDRAKQLIVSELVFVRNESPEASEEWLYKQLENNGF
ncbi:MAG: CarD family transcriptional regulator [Selenomonadaceae bacterium]